MSIPDNEEKTQEAFQPQQGHVSEADTGIEAEHPDQVLQWEWESGTVPAARAPFPLISTCGSPHLLPGVGVWHSVILSSS